MPLTQVPASTLPYTRFEEVLTREQYERLEQTVEAGRRIFDGRVVFTVNSTARGGGVAELLTSLVAYVRGAGIDARWMVIEGDPEFFRLTKRIHNRLHGFEGDGGPLGDAEHETYRRTLESNARELAEVVCPGDCVLLHDPQTAGLVEPLRARGAAVVWRCHVGLDRPNDHAREAWRFLQRYVAPADAYVFSRPAFVWDDLEDAKLAIIPPTIDAFSPKNAEMAPDVVDAVLHRTGIASAESSAQATFTRTDGTPGRVDRATDAVQARPIAPHDRVLVQVSRWDRLKDPAGVMKAFERDVASVDGAHLALAGPSTKAVADDPEGAEVLREVLAAREAMPAAVRDRVHLLSLPMDDLEENAAIVNALQRRADVLAQKSLAEGFGLTVAEGMWKARPMIGTRVGGIQDQIVDGETGLLVDPNDLDEFGAAAARLMADRDRAERLGQAAHDRVREEFLGPRTLWEYLQLFERVLRPVTGR